MYGVNIARVLAALVFCGPWHGNPRLSSVYMISATKWHVHPLLVFGQPAFFFFGT